MSASPRFPLQPQTAVPLSARAVQDNCVAAVLFGAGGLNAANGKPPFSIGANNSFVASPYGMALRGTSAVGGLGLTQGSFEDLIPVADSFTVMMLVRVASLGTRRFIAGDFDAPGNNVTYNLHKSNANQFVSGNIATSAAGLGWYWVEDVINRAPGEAHFLYATGLSDGADNVQPRTTNPSAGKFRVGSSGEFTADSFDGDIAVCLIFKKALSDEARKAYRNNPSLAFSGSFGGPTFTGITEAKIRGPKMLSRVRTIQPQNPVGVDRGNPITRGIRLAWSGFVADRAATGQVFGNPATQINIVTPEGRAFNTSSNPADAGSFPLTSNFTELTYVIDVREIASASGHLFGTAEPNYGINKGTSFVRGSSNLGVTMVTAGPTSTTVYSPNTVVYGQWRKVALRIAFNGTDYTLSLFESGVLTASATGGYTPTTRASINFCGTMADAIFGTTNASLRSAFVWNRALSDAEIKSVSTNPYQIFAPVETPIWLTEGVQEISASASIDLAATPTSTATATAALTTGIQLAATPAALATMTAALPTGDTALAAAPAAQASSTAALTSAIRLAATPSALATASAALSTGIQLAATPASVVSATAALAPGVHALAATPADAASATGALTTSIRLAATPADVSSATGALTTSIQMAAAPAAAATVTADLTAPGGSMAAAPATIASATAALSTVIRLAAAPADVASASGALTTAITLAAAPAALASATAAVSTGIRLAATPTDVASSTGALTTAIRLASDAAGLVTATADLTAPGTGLAATPAALAIATAALTTSVRLAATPADVAGASAALSTGILLASAVATLATVTAALTTTPAGFAAAPATTASATASLTTGIRMSAAASSAATATANLLTAVMLSSSAQVQATSSASLTAPGAMWTAAAVVQSIAAANLTTQILLAAQAGSSASGSAFLTVNAAPPFVPSLSTAHWVAKRNTRNWVVAGE